MSVECRIPLPDWAPPFAAKSPWWGGHLQTLASKFGTIGDRSKGYQTEHFILPLNDESGDSLAATLYTPNQPRERRVGIAMSNSFGFGGHNASVVVGQLQNGSPN